MTQKTQWFNSLYNPPVQGYYWVEIGSWPTAQGERAFWDGRAWRRNHHENEQFVRIHNIARWLMEFQFE